MADISNNLVEWAREVRAKDDLQADPSVLEEIRAFFDNHTVDNAKEATHVVLEGYPDWWCRGRRAPLGLAFTDQDLEELFRHAGYLYQSGIPLTLGERRTPTFRLFQDIEVWGSSRENSMRVEELIGPDCALTAILAKIIGEVFIGNDFLDAAIYDATGLSHTKGVRKTSIRIVWPGITVDSDRAVRARDLLVHKLTAAAAENGSPMAELQAQLREYSQSNAWHSVFGDAAYGVRSQVRMPLSDRVSPLPLRTPERRPFTPVGVLRITYPGDNVKNTKIEWLCREGELEASEWMKIGSLRQGDSVPLSEWSVPSFQQGLQPVAPSSTRGGRVKVRTAGGSDGAIGLKLKAATKDRPEPERAGQLLTVERRFSCGVEEFCEKMAVHLGQATIEGDGSYVWKQPSGDARIVMYNEDKRVKVIGRPNQVRSLVVIVSPFTEAQPILGAAQGVALQNTQSRQGPGPLPDGRSPGNAYAPVATETAVGSTSVDNSEGAEGTNEQDSSDGSAVGQLRVAQQSFESQGQGELGLELDEAVRVTHDPEGALAGSIDRWVYGQSEVSGNCGWFPLSHTKLAEELARTET